VIKKKIQGGRLWLRGEIVVGFFGSLPIPKKKLCKTFNLIMKTSSL
jgi:hypothetical protein